MNHAGQAHIGECAMDDDSGRTTFLSAKESKLIAIYRDPQVWYNELSAKDKVLVRLWLATGNHNIGLHIFRDLLVQNVESDYRIATPCGSNQFALFLG